MGRTARILITVVASVLAFVAVVLFVFPSGCQDLGGVPSWERCTTYLGTPAFSVEDFGWGSELNIVVPLVATALVAVGTWWLLGRLGQNNRQRS
jgi:hypothetical protein